MNNRIITAADMVDILREQWGDHSFCCPLIGAYPCERHIRGCVCHELHLINHHRLLTSTKQTTPIAPTASDGTKS